MSKARLKLDAHGAASIVEIDGVRVEDSVTAAVVEAAAGRPPQLTLKFALINIEVEGEMEVRLPDADREALVKLGWTPPEGS